MDFIEIDKITAEKILHANALWEAFPPLYIKDTEEVLMDFYNNVINLANNQNFFQKIINIFFMRKFDKIYKETFHKLKYSSSFIHKVNQYGSK